MSRYIDAADVVKRYEELVNEVENGIGHYSTGNEAVVSLKDLLDDIPTADVRENITAHKVIGGGEHDGATCWFECSRCGKTVDVNDKYCSECGAMFVD